MNRKTTLSTYAALMVGAILMAAAVAPATAQDGTDALRFMQRLPGLSSASAGMGGAGTAGRSDVGAFTTNPAGLGWNQGSWFSIDLLNQNTTDEATFTAPGSESFLESDVSSTGLASLAYAYRVPTIRGTLVVGAGFNQVQSFSRSLFYSGTNNANSVTDYFMPLPGEFTLDSDDQGVFPSFTRDLSFIAFETFGIDLVPDLVDAGDPVPFLPAVSAGTVLQDGFVEEKGRMSELNFAGSVEVAPNVMVGASLNLPFGSYTYFRSHSEDDFQNDNDGFDGTTDFSGLTFEESFSSDMIGVSLRAGLSAKVADGARFGLTVETPTYLSVDEEYSTLLDVSFDNGDRFVYGDGLTETAGSGTFEYTVTSPWKVAIGGAWTGGGLTLTGDVEWVDWSQLELDASEYSFADENLEIQRALDAVLNVRLGAEYVMNQLSVRAGWAGYPDPRDADSPLATPNLVDRGRQFVSAGLGFAFTEQVSASLSWTRSMWDDQFAPYADVTGAPDVREELTRDRVAIGFTFGF